MKTQTTRSTNSTSTSPSESLARLEKVVMVPSHPRSTLSAVFVYEDAETREWARELHDRVSDLAGSNSVRPTWWKLNNLFEPGVLAAAVSTAMRADIIVAAVRTEEGLPLPFYTWVNNWLPHRLQPGGVLVALVGGAGSRARRLGRVGGYLRSVAHQAHLNFLIDQRPLNNVAPSATHGPVLNGHAANGFHRSSNAARVRVR